MMTVLVAPKIPLDMQIEIVNRLPIKSLARFKCVSKLWSSLIDSKGYLFASPPRLYISSREENEFQLSSLSLASTCKSSTVFNLDTTKQGIGGYDMVALRGLILFNYGFDAFIYNPTTEQKIDLPEIKFNMSIIRCMMKPEYFLGYNPVLDKYKVVCTTCVLYEKDVVQHWVFVLEAGSSWKSIEFDHFHFPMRQRVFINGVIYYLASNTVFSCMAISFDVRTEESNMIQVSSVVGEYIDSNYLELIEYGGKPTIFDHTNIRDSLVKLWVLEDSGKWSKKTISVKPCQMHFFSDDSIDFVGIGTTQNGEVILNPRRMFSQNGYILYYDLHKNDVRRVDIRGISKYPLCLALMDTGENIMHLKI